MPPRKNEVVSTGYEQLIANLRNLKMNRVLPVFALHVDKNGGMLPDRIPAHACWYYCIIGHKHLTRVEEGGIYEGDADTVNSLFEIAKAVAAFYNLDSPAQFLRHMGDCRLEALRLGYEWNPEIEEPLKSLFRNGNGPSRIIS